MVGRFRPEASAWINVLAVLGTAQMKLLVKVSCKKKRNDNQLVVTTVNKMGGPSRPTFQDTFQTISIISRKCLTFPVSLCANNEILISLNICINNELQFEHRGKVIVTQREHLVSLQKNRLNDRKSKMWLVFAPEANIYQTHLTVINMWVGSESRVYISNFRV